MKIKILTILLALAMLLSLSACANSSTKQDQIGGAQTDPNTTDGVTDSITDGVNSSVTTDTGRETDSSADASDSESTGDDVVPPAENASQGLQFELNRNGDGYVLKGIGSCSDDVIIIPNTYEGKPVTEIAQRAFYGAKGIVEVVIPETVKVIGGAAFNMCSLSKVTIPEGVELIEGSAFNNCMSLVEVVLPESVKEIGAMAFISCAKLTKLTMPKNCHVVGADILAGTPIYNDMNNWDGGIFYHQGYLLGTDREVVSGNVTIKSDTKVICSQAFERCSQLTGITVPEGVVSIGFSAFGSCELLNSVTLPDTLAHLEDAFGGDPITDGVLEIVYIGNHVVKANVGGEVVIKDGTLTISSRAGLVPNSLTLPKSLVFIGTNAINLRNCNSITYKGTKSEWEAINKADSWDLDKTGYSIVCTDGTITK